MGNECVPCFRRVRTWNVQYVTESGGKGSAGTGLPRHPRARLLGRYHPGGEGCHTPEGWGRGESNNTAAPEQNLWKNIA